MFIALAVAVMIVAAVGVNVFMPGSTTKAIATSNTLSPHEIHVNYQNIKDLPVHEVKEPF
jgi:hypothetical protein